MTMPKDFHMGRSWSGHHMEDECPCPQEPCGLIARENAVESCPQHYFGRAKTMRSIHRAEDCAKIVTENAALEASKA